LDGVFDELADVFVAFDGVRDGPAGWTVIS
jgi:hypothetical protein